MLHELLDDMGELAFFDDDLIEDPEALDLDLNGLGTAVLAQALKGFLADDEYSEDEAEDDKSEGELERLALEEEQEMFGSCLPRSLSLVD